MLKVYAGPEVTPAEFRQMCSEAARQGCDVEIEKATAAFERKIDTLQTRLRSEERELSQDESELSQRKMEETGTHLENVIGLFSKRKSSRRLSSSLTKRRLTEQAKSDVEESLEVIADLKKQINELEKEMQRAADEINGRWGDVVNQSSDITLTPLKKDVLLDFFGVAWFPYHLLQVGSETIELPGFGQAT
jgi:superfamily II RNA helicase